MRQPASDTEAHNVGHIFCARAPSSFLTRSMKHTMERCAGPHVERTDSFWRVNFVTDERQQIDAEFIHIRLDLACGLRRVGMKKHAVFVSDRGEFGDRLNRTGLVVCMHDGNEDGLGCDRVGKSLRIHKACSVYLQKRHVKSHVTLQISATFQDGWM